MRVFLLTVIILLAMVRRGGATMEHDVQDLNELLLDLRSGDVVTMRCFDAHVHVRRSNPERMCVVLLEEGEKPSFERLIAPWLGVFHAVMKKLEAFDHLTMQIEVYSGACSRLVDLEAAILTAQPLNMAQAPNLIIVTVVPVG